MTFKEIQDLIKLMDKSTLTEFSYKTETYEVKIKGQQNGNSSTYVAAPIQNAMPSANQLATTPSVSQTHVSSMQSEQKKEEPVVASAKLLEIKSPMVGTFYRSSGPDKSAYVNVGDSISKGSVVCIIEAMKLFNEIESEFSGKIVKVMVEDASPVEYDQVIFLVEP
ncbi:MAG: acetyl-CoA carboxylase, biotin carboxyl carrier protein [Bacteroidota bacterium]|jgi:acetyl-CoA carboxylase biotin carboxyl carrier protein